MLNLSALSKKIKTKIQRSFNRASQTYNKHAIVQPIICQQLLKQIPTTFQKSNRIGDLACGTGLSTQLLTDYLDYNICYAIDFAKDLLTIAKTLSLKKTLFIESDFDFLYNSLTSIDLMFCNMGLQWSTNLDQTLKNLKHCIKVNGLLVFSLPLENNFPELKIHSKNPMLSENQLITLLRNNNFDLIKTENFYFQQHFSSRRGLLKSLSSTGVNCLLQNAKQQGLTQPFIKHHHSPIQLTYHIGLFVALNRELT